MRQLLTILTILLLLCGCAQAAPEESTETVPPTVPEPIPTTQATQPPDPMALLLEAMTVEEKVGQLFLARCPAVNALEDLASYHLGGYLLFGQDFQNEDPDSFRAKIAAYQAHAPIPLLIAVDEEGGTVCRVSSHSTFRAARFPSPRAAYAAGGLEQALAMETEKSLLLSGLGINVNMGPVCDIALKPGSFLYRRSLGQDPAETAGFVSSTVQIMANHRIGSVLKHFPGYGENGDTHTGSIRDSRPLEELEGCDLVPFRAGIQAGCDAVLVSHNIVEALDGSLPASLSPAVHGYLRDTLGFTGVIMTDDLAMGAITEAWGPEEAAVQAVLAGNDLLCSSDYSLQYGAMLEAVETGRISLEQLNQSVLRILTWKKELGLIF